MRIVKPTLLALVAAAACACAASSTQLEETWTHPRAENLKFNKVLAVVVAHDAASRRAAEDRLARQISEHYPGVEAVPAYQVLGAARSPDSKALRRTLMAQGFDGVIAIRVLEAHTVTELVPGTFAGFYGAFGPGIYGPGMVRKARVASAETDVFDLHHDRLVWSGKTRTVEPGSVEHLVAEVSKKARKDLENRGIL